MRTIKRFADGSKGKVMEDFSWSIRLPDGSTPDGQEADAESALAKVEQIHTAFVMQCWDAGRHTPHGFLVPVRSTNKVMP